MLDNISQFATIYDQHKGLVYTIALNYLQNTEDAEEITQDVFVQLHQSLHQFKNKSTLKT